MKFGRLAVILAMAGISVSLCACGHKEAVEEDSKITTSDLFEKIDSEKQSVVNDSEVSENPVDAEVTVNTEADATSENSETIAQNTDALAEGSESVQADTQSPEGDSNQTGADQNAEGDPAQVQAEVQVNVSEETPAADANVVSEATAGMPGVTATYDLQTLENMHYSDEQMQQICQFYNGAVFAGDSVLLGFRNYSAKSSDPMLTQLQFLAAGSLSLHNAFWPVSEKSVHPLYQGAQHPIWESMQMMGANKAFLFFGINDVSYNIDESVALYPQLVDKIREYSPGMDITIISATYTLKDLGKGKLNNTNIAAFNQGVRALAEQNGWGYIDMATVLSDGAGNLAPEYCSDGFLHESKKAYNVWTQMLVRYAAERLGLQETPAENIAQEVPENNG
ncbi:GDSL-type esterase/lipase family protein [Butyrivibrio sp. VCD2006]|uniref:GDSL-type esterase/lipase family protein n=1 Tax=Butyrivibrio sp. VCD2006 TaxID=1280664 RepID=UPI00041AFB61|nr:GDSL-type esterase/lipase family protein [Butyrivibrio sp. VCD2006]